MAPFDPPHSSAISSQAARATTIQHPSSPSRQRSEPFKRWPPDTNVPTKEDRAGALLREWQPVLARLAIDDRDARDAARHAQLNDTGFALELVMTAGVDERELFEAIADELGLPFMADIDETRLVMGERQRLAFLSSRFGPPSAMLEDGAGRTIHVFARLDIDIVEMRARLARWPELRARLWISPPSALRTALMARTQQRLLFDACYDLFLRAPELSARVVVNGSQGLFIGIVLVALPVLLSIQAQATMLTLYMAGSIGFLLCVVLRVLAFIQAKPLKLQRFDERIVPEMPIYSVLVALYREREVVPQLLVALGRLQWPRSKLEIKLVCEADDHATLSALRAHKLHPCVEIIEVPPGPPRTKPKALAYALPQCSGEFVTLYDAEDRPHPLQLLAAWRRFKTEDDDLACLQAPLVVTNRAASPLSYMFAFEYAGLFRGMLPYLARAGLTLPLGGTSNHFRRPALVDAGGWDAHNVTEDADLGLRLTRLGYRVGVISHPTFEDGPEELKVWLPQRVRWFKGWIQTWLVHMRQPFLLSRELGVMSFITAQILSAGMVVSALVHPIFVASLLYALVMLAANGALNSFEVVMAAFGVVNIIFGYGAFIALGWKSLSHVEKESLPLVIALTPLHWLLLSVAAWLAVFELYWRPHHWNKTPHRLARASRRQASADEGSPITDASSSPISSRSRPS